MNILVIGSLYLVQALKNNHNVISAGIGGQYDIPLNHYFCDLEKDILKQCPKNFNPDIIMLFESSNMVFPLGIEATTITTALHLMDSHVNIEWHKEYASVFDYIFVCQKDYIPVISSQTLAKCLFTPLSFNPLINRSLNLEKKYDCVFVGTVHEIYHQRIEYLSFFKKHLNLKVFSNVFGEDMNKLFNESKIILNHPIKNDLNYRVFEAMGSGTMLLTPQTGNGLTDLFTDAEDCVFFNPENLMDGVDKCRYHLKHPDEREKIAIKGCQKVHELHTFQKRAKDIIQFIENNPVSKKTTHKNIYKNIGNAFYMLGQLDYNFGKKKKYKLESTPHVLSMFSKHIHKNPEDLDGYSFLAATINENSLDDSLHLYNSMLHENSNFLFKQSGRFIIELKNNHRVRALQTLKSLLQKDSDKTISILEKLYLKNTPSLKGFITLATLYADIGYNHEAIHYFSKAHELDPENSDIKNCLKILNIKLS